MPRASCAERHTETVPTPDDVELALKRVVAAMETGELRPQQVDMARAVSVSISSKRHLMVQAGTGVGKSYGYLVPAVVMGTKTIVATTTIASVTMTGSAERA